MAPLARRCRPIVDLDLDELASIEPPRGFGRDSQWVATSGPRLAHGSPQVPPAPSLAAHWKALALGAGPPLWTPWTTRSAGATSPVLSTELSPKPALA